MAALPLASSFPSIPCLKRRPLALSERRLAANRRNATRSTGPRTAKGKARVACNPIKHGFFADPARWTDEQQREFAELFVGLRNDFQPQTEREQDCVVILADSYVRMAALLRYEGIAALEYYRQCERELEARIAAADADEAARLTAHREELRRAGLWGPTIPAPRELKAITRCEGRLHRVIEDAVAELEQLQKAKKQTHFVERNRGIFDPRSTRGDSKGAKTNRDDTSSGGVPNAARRTSAQRFDSDLESAKTNPLNAAFTGNRHERRRAKALARRRT